MPLQPAQRGMPAPAAAAPPPLRVPLLCPSVGTWGTTVPQILHLGPWSPMQTERHLKRPSARSLVPGRQPALTW